jgi:hypothetical protein
LPETDQRSQGRSNVFLAATLHGGGAPTPVRIRNISVRGALIEGIALPPVGSVVDMVRGELRARAELAWSRGGIAGIKFTDPIDVESWVRRVGHSGQQRVDRVVAALRRPGSLPADSQTGGRLESLRSISTALDEVCESLAATGSMSVELGEELVKLDAIAQALRRVATGRAF